MDLARLAILLAAALAAPPAPTAMQIHRDAVVVDLHADTLLDLAAGRRTLAGGSGSGHVDLPRLRQGGVDVQVFAAFIHPREAAQGRARVRTLITAFHRAIDRHAGEISHARTVGEIETGVAAGKIAAVLAIENGGDAIQGEVEQIDWLYREGVRIMGLVWNQANALADGALEARHGGLEARHGGLEARHGGLTPLGRRAVERMQALGIAIDVSHLSPAAFWDVLAATRGPLVATHSNADAIHSHRRNLTDDQLRAIAARGGVVGVNFYPVFLGGTTLDRVVAHIDHMVRVMGIDHVALGSDFDGIRQVPQGLEDVSRLPNLTAALLARGYTSEQVQKILGANALRVFRQVWGR